MPPTDFDWYSKEQMYTGWWASFIDKGQGIAKIDDSLIVQGQWSETLGFPNNGKDFINNGNIESYTVQTMYKREKSIY